jgi:hypothetical protein
MTSIPVEQLTFTFEPSVVPFQYEKDAVCVAGWPQGSKVVDDVAHDLPVPVKHPLVNVGLWVRSKAWDREHLNNFMSCMIMNP